MYSLLRHADRQHNINFYPRLFFPDIYIMEGGYCEFWQKFGNTSSISVPDHGGLNGS